MGQITKKTGSVKNADVAMPDEGSAQYDDLMEETGGAAASDGFDLAAHIAATSGADAVEDDDETDDASDDPVIDPVSEQDDESADQYDSRFDSEEDAIRYAEETIQGPLTRDDDGTLVNQYGEVMVYDSDGNLAPKPRDPIALDDQAPFSGADDQLEDSRAPEFNVELPAVGSAEYEALMFETGGAAANDGFNYQAHLAATGQLDKLVELDPDYDPELDPVFDDGFEPPFDSSSPEAGIDRGGLVGAATFEEFLEQTNGVDVGALGAYLTPEEITQVLDRFGGDP
ncbi:hypothetical protein N9W46_09710, partial [Litoricolaceae bacterium]|nr:hypothetical protein [Litorivicinaceae bacterium]